MIGAEVRVEIRPAADALAPPQLTARAAKLAARAAELFPDNPGLQREWLRAVSVVRSTRAGWILDRFVVRRQDVFLSARPSLSTPRRGAST